MAVVEIHLPPGLRSDLFRHRRWDVCPTSECDPPPERLVDFWFPRSCVAQCAALLRHSILGGGFLDGWDL